MLLDNKLGLGNQADLARAEEHLSKKKAKLLFESGKIDEIEVGTFAGLAFIHRYLFEDIYPWAGEVRTVNISKGNFRFAPCMYLSQSLEHIDSMPHGNFDEIVEKYVEMNVAHPFREGNGRSMRIWLDLMLKRQISKVVEWNKISREDYLSAMERSVVKDIELKVLLRDSLGSQINDAVFFFQNLDVSYFYEGYQQFKTEEL